MEAKHYLEFTPSIKYQILEIAKELVDFTKIPSMNVNVYFDEEPISENRLAMLGKYYIDNGIINRKGGPKIDLLIKQINKIDGEQLLAKETLDSINGIFDGFSKLNIEVPIDFIQAIDRLLYLKGYSGKRVVIQGIEKKSPDAKTFVYSHHYAKELIYFL
jgi:hypothetical protein